MSTDSQNQAPTPLTESEAAYGRFVPQQFLQLLGRPSIVEVELGDHVEKEMTLLFSDIRDFTLLSEAILPAENFRFINSYLSTMEPVVARNRGIIDKYIGDGIMALFPGTADDGVRAGIDMLRRLVIYNQGRSRAGYAPIRIGIGLNTGLVMMGTVGGPNRMDSTVIGDAVNLASRLEGLTKNYGTPLIISDQTLHSLEDRGAYSIRFLDRLSVRGRYQAQSVYEVFDADPEPLWLAKQETKQAFEEAVAFFHMGRADLARPMLEECLRGAPDDKAARSYLKRCAAADQGEAHGSVVGGMPDATWRDEYSVLIEEIDAQHKELLARAANIAALVAQGDGAVGGTLNALTEFSQAHFNTEENLMRRYGYPFIEEHLRQHRAFQSACEGLCEEILTAQRDQLYLLFRIQLLLVDWQINHTTKSDFHLGNFLLRAGIN
ncbi:bacteriohemerythrin [Denitratisoma oestradiolicum]|uniref:Adenylate/guanylate cyclase n=1 Tax=Denitratisoma oestradiolicum TaxID=311182 RepID=A0A6S6XZU5_9PROT|nr:bacteriohemerythrin [Denitratisoma oestradiolicum]TWO81578.1 hypothetical protein CBW56_02355 [Denitratisoma oestradiolicum]CAB1370513.1 Adenylate/guanylate cyclase [Denitratisoma oestradiolicum]